MSELQAMTGSLGPCVSGHGSQLTCIPWLQTLTSTLNTMWQDTWGDGKCPRIEASFT